MTTATRAKGSPLAGDQRSNITGSPSKVVAQYHKQQAEERARARSPASRWKKAKQVLPAILRVADFHYATRERPPSYSFGSRPNTLWTGESTDPTRDRNKASIPGPGKYNNKSTLGPQGRTHHDGFSIMSRPKTAEERRLEALERKEQLMEEARAAYRRKQAKLEERLSRSPSRGSSPDPNRSFSPAPSLHARIDRGVAWDSTTLASTVNTFVPGPGAYNERDSWGSSGRRFSMYGRLDKRPARRSNRSSADPGPGAYEVEDSWRTRSATPSAAFATESSVGVPRHLQGPEKSSLLAASGGFLPPTAFFAPGPGEYTYEGDQIGSRVRSRSQNGSSFGSAPRLPEASGRRAVTPGPGAYFTGAGGGERRRSRGAGVGLMARPSTTTPGGRSTVMGERARTATPSMMRGGQPYGRSTVTQDQGLPGVQSSVF